MSLDRTLSVGWDKNLALEVSQSAVGSTDISNQAISVVSPGRMKHLRLLCLTAGLASGATLAFTFEAKLYGTDTWIEVAAFTIDEDSARNYLFELYEVDIYTHIRFSVNKTGNSCLNIVNLSKYIGEMPFKTPDTALAASSSPDSPLFPDLAAYT